MSRRRKAVLIESSEEEPAETGAPASGVARRTLSRLRKADGDAAFAAEEGLKGLGAAAAPPPPTLVTPARPAPRQAPPNESPRTGAQPHGLRHKLRDRGTRSAAKQRQQRALQRLTSGRGGVADLVQDDSGSGSGSGGEEEPESSGGGKPAWGRLAWPRPPRQSRGSGLESELEVEEEEEDGEEEDWDDDLGGFVVEDEDTAAAAFAELRGVTGGSAMTDDERHQLLCQLRLLRLLDTLPAGAELSPEERACVAAALEIERDLRQQREQANNLEGWRRADAGMREKFEECPVIKRGERTFQMGRHCAFCRHDRRKRIVLHPLSFQGTRQPVVWLEPELRRRGLLPGRRDPEHGMLHAPMDSSEEEEEEEAEEQPSDGSGSSSEDGETLLERYNRRHAAQPQASGKRRRQQQRQAAGRKRRRAAVRQVQVSSEEEGEEEEGGEEEEEEDGAEESSGSDSDPAQDDSDASDRGANPRRHPRIGVDCWARAFMYHAIHRYPARLDSMLLALTRRYLDATPEERWPASRAGLARAVVLRHGHLLQRHWSAFQRDVSDFNVLQNQTKDKTLQNARIVDSLKDQLYASAVQLERQEQLRGVDIAAELARFDAAAAARRQQQRRRRRRAGREAGAATSDGGEEADGEGLLLRIEGAQLGEVAVEEDGNVSADEEEEDSERLGQPGSARAGSDETGGGSSGEEAGGSRRLPRRQAGDAAGRRGQPAIRTPAAQQRPKAPSWQQRSRARPQGGQRAANAIASAFAAFAQRQQEQQEQQAQVQQQEQQAGNEQDEVIVIDSEGDDVRKGEQEQQQQQPQPPPQQEEAPSEPASSARCACCDGAHATSDCPHW